MGACSVVLGRMTAATLPLEGRTTLFLSTASQSRQLSSGEKGTRLGSLASLLTNGQLLSKLSDDVLQAGSRGPRTCCCNHVKP